MFFSTLNYVKNISVIEFDSKTQAALDSAFQGPTQILNSPVERTLEYVNTIVTGGSTTKLFDKFFFDATEVYFSTPFSLLDECRYYFSTANLHQTTKNIIGENVQLMSFQNLYHIFLSKTTHTLGTFEYLLNLPSYWNYKELPTLNIFPYKVNFLYDYSESLFLIKHSFKIDLTSISYEYTKHVNNYNTPLRIMQEIKELLANAYPNRGYNDDDRDFYVPTLDEATDTLKHSKQKIYTSKKLENSIMWTDIYNRYDYNEIVGPRNIPDSKMYYPEPFVASPSFHHEDIWFIHILHYQYWLWFFFISIITFFFITFINVVKWCNMRNKPRKETRGVSRSKCADLITASVPVTWAASIIVAENVDAVDYYDGFGTGEIVIGIRAYQWGWEYFYPKTIDLQYNVTPSYSQLIGNSLKYSNTTTQSINLNKFWKYYQQKTNTATSAAPSNLLLNPTSQFNILNINSYNKLGLDLTIESEYTRHINYYTKNNPQYIYNSIGDYNLKYQKINNLYLNESDIYNTLTYGGHRQLQYTNYKSTLNRGQTVLEKRSVENFLKYHDVLSNKKKTPINPAYLLGLTTAMQNNTTGLLDKDTFANYDFYAHARYQIVESALWETSYPTRENLENILTPESVFNDLEVILANWRIHVLLQYFRENPTYLDSFRGIHDLIGTLQYRLDENGNYALNDDGDLRPYHLLVSPTSGHELTVVKNLDFYTRGYEVLASDINCYSNALWKTVFDRQGDWQTPIILDNPLNTSAPLSDVTTGVDPFGHKPPVTGIETADEHHLEQGAPIKLALQEFSFVLQPLIGYVLSNDNNDIQTGLGLNALLSEHWAQATNAYSYNNFVKHTLLPYGKYINFINELNYDELEMSYELYKNVHNYYNLNYNNIMNAESQITTNISYLNMANTFKLVPTDDYLISNMKSSNSNTQLNLNYTNFLKSSTNVLKLTDEIDFLASLKWYTRRLSAIHKVYKSKYDENHSFFQMLDVSNSYLKYPLLSDRKFNYNYLLSKNSEYYFATNLYNIDLLNNFSELFVLSNSLNTYLSDLPFLMSIRTDATRYLWFDWFTRWSSIEISAAKSAKQSLLGMPYHHRKNLYSLETEPGKYWARMDNYMLKIAKGRRNYMSSWSTVPYHYTRIRYWYKFYYNNLRMFDNSYRWKPFIYRVKTFARWHEPELTLKRTKFITRLLSAKNHNYTPSYSLMNTPHASYYKDFNKRQFAITTLVDILSKREYLYRQYYNNCQTLKYLPSSVQVTPKNPILTRVKSVYNFNNPTVYSTEVTREHYYSKQSYIKFLLLKDIVNWNYEIFSKVPVNVSKIMNYLYFTVNNEYDWSNKVYTSTSALKNQFRPMRKGITNMLKLHTTGAVAMPIEIRLHFVASSRDIIHSWAIPSAGIKIDCLPGFSAHRVLIFLSTGIFWGQCMEVCGRYHHWMPIVIYFMKRDLFFLWCTHFMHYSSVDDFFTTNDRQLIDRTYYRNLKTTVWADEISELL